MHNPIREAETWLKNKNPPDCSLFIVLGLGAGYHVTTLAQSFPNSAIIVLEAHTEIISWVKANRPQVLAQVAVSSEPLSHLCKLWITPKLNQVYRVLVHEPSWATSPQFYFDWYQFLLLRNQEALGYYLENRPQAIKWLENFTDSPVTIKHLISHLEGAPFSKTETTLWRCLGELVK